MVRSWSSEIYGVVTVSWRHGYHLLQPSWMLCWAMPLLDRCCDELQIMVQQTFSNVSPSNHDSWHDSNQYPFGRSKWSPNQWYSAWWWLSGTLQCLSSVASVINGNACGWTSTPTGVVQVKRGDNMELLAITSWVLSTIGWLGVVNSTFDRSTKWKSYGPFPTSIDT